MLDVLLTLCEHIGDNMFGIMRLLWSPPRACSQTSDVQSVIGVCLPLVVVLHGGLRRRGVAEMLGYSGPSACNTNFTSLSKNRSPALMVTSLPLLS